MIIKKWNLPEIHLAGGETCRHEWPDAEDMFKADGIGFTAHTESVQPLRLRITLLPLQNGRPEFITHASAEILLPPGGGKIEIPFTLFDNRQLVRAHLRYIRAIELTLLSEGADLVSIGEAGAVCRGDLLAEVEKSSSRVGETGSVLTYSVQLRNGLNQSRCVMLHADYTGREVLEWQYPETVMLPP